jgi:integrase/recombinase XerD
MSPPSLTALMEAYFVDLRVVNWTEATLERRKNSLGRFVRWLTEREIHTLSEITPEILAAYQRSLLHIGNLRTRKPLQASTRASYVHAVSHWLQWACLGKHIPFNPAAGIELPKAEYRLPASFLSQSEVEHVINQPDVSTKIGIRDRSVLEILYSSAIRRSELLKLEIQDIDRARRLLHIRQGKGHKDRFVPIGVRALDWLTKYLQDVRPWLLSGGGCKRNWRHPRKFSSSLSEQESQVVILCHNGRAMHPVNLSAMVRRYVRQAGITKKGSCHMFRHTAATLMMENGADLRSIQTLLGHASLNTTQIYAHVTLDRLRAVHDAMHPAKPDQASLPSRAD